MKKYSVFGDTTRHRGSQRCGVKIGVVTASNSELAYQIARLRYKGDFTNIKVRLVPND